MPADVQARLRSSSARKQLKIGDVVFETQSNADFVYFPEDSATISVIRELTDGDMIEVGVIGDEGAAGLYGFLGSPTNPDRGICQNAGSMLCTPLKLMREEIDKSPLFLNLILRFVNSMLAQVTQTAACNRLHALETRLGRWLLMMHDRARKDALSVTQEFLSHMLGTRTAGINEAVASLTAAGAIGHTRNRIDILDRKKLESLSCECYQYVRDAYAKTLAA